MYELSIVIPTCNRAALLERALDAIALTTRLSHEIIVINGASSDATAGVLQTAKAHLGDRLVVIEETHREGFVKAVNKGFRAARGHYLTWLNDDARPLAGALDSAVMQRSPPSRPRYRPRLRHCGDRSHSFGDNSRRQTSPDAAR